MLKHAKMIRWLVPICLLLLLSILLLAVNYTASATPLDLNAVATAVGNVNQTATVRASHQKPGVPTRTPTPVPTRRLPAVTPTATK